MQTSGLEFRQSLKVGDVIYRVLYHSIRSYGVSSCKKMIVKTINKTNITLVYTKNGTEIEEIFSIKTGKNKVNSNDILMRSESEEKYFEALKEIRRKNNIRKIRDYDLSDISTEKAIQILAILEDDSF